VSDLDPEIVITLPLSAVDVVVRHLHLGIYVGNDVHAIIKAITDQANPQIAATLNPSTLPAGEALN
jgi:hypothetical protein